MFGSRARGQAHARSDYDIAVQFQGGASDPWGMPAKLQSDLLAQLPLDDCDLNVVDIRGSSKALRLEILSAFVGLKGSVDDIRRVLASDRLESQ